MKLQSLLWNLFFSSFQPQLYGKNQVGHVLDCYYVIKCAKDYFPKHVKSELRNSLNTPYDLMVHVNFGPSGFSPTQAMFYRFGLHDCAHRPSSRGQMCNLVPEHFPYCAVTSLHSFLALCLLLLSNLPLTLPYLQFDV